MWCSIAGNMALNMEHDAPAWGKLFSKKEELSKDYEELSSNNGKLSNDYEELFSNNGMLSNDYGK